MAPRSHGAKDNGSWPGVLPTPGAAPSLAAARALRDGPARCLLSHERGVAAMPKAVAVDVALSGQRGRWTGEPGSHFRGDPISYVEAALTEDGAHLGIVIGVGERSSCYALASEAIPDLIGVLERANEKLADRGVVH